MNLLHMILRPFRWFKRQWLSGKLYWLDEKLTAARWSHQCCSGHPIASYKSLQKVMELNTKRRALVHRIIRLK